MLKQLYIIEQSCCFMKGNLNGLWGRGRLGRNIIGSYRRCLAAKVIGTEWVRSHYVCHFSSPALIVATVAALTECPFRLHFL